MTTTTSSTSGALTRVFIYLKFAEDESKAKIIFKWIISLCFFIDITVIFVAFGVSPLHKPIQISAEEVRRIMELRPPYVSASSL